ncbi:nuclear transport factor 2 family protein [Saccharopolyspora cebuensis]|uniref:Nuclear transport factor 2 family protein n=1 Tax=Saccharopolyspora cebuensis TaxID=418759 RepID=A0ABV4CQJ7_9PSEU
MTQNNEPVDLLHRLLDALRRYDWTEVEALWGEDGVIEYPFAGPGMPERLVGGRRIAEHIAAIYPVRAEVTDVGPVVVHRTEDPATIVAEFTARGRVVRTGAPYELSYLAVLTASGGRIARYRDHFSPVAAAVATGSVAELAAALAEAA